jgi:RNA polymerase sigma-70 factor (ECF subfamily)
VVVYCLVPAELAAKLHGSLQAHFSDQPGVEVVVEMRHRERRRRGERRKHQRPLPEAGDRRRIRSATGRRMGERRAALVVGEGPPLPRKASRYAERLTFVERLEPSTREAEDLDTARLVAQTQAGDHDAFEVIYLRYFDRMSNYLRIVLDDPHDAEDSTQQVFLQAFEGIASYERRDTPFRAWLFAIARNHVIARLRARGRLDLMESEGLDRIREAGSTVEEELPVLDWISDRDLVLFVNRLPIPQRQVLLLRFMLDFSNEESASALGRTANEVRVLQHRAICFLRDRLAAIGREPKASRRPAMARCPSKARVLRERRFALL